VKSSDSNAKHAGGFNKPSDDRQINIKKEEKVCVVCIHMLFNWALVSLKKQSKLVTGCSNLTTCLTTTETHMPYGITECYLPSGSGDITIFTPAKLSWYSI